MRLCSVAECGRPVNARGWCASHYARWRRFGEPTAGPPIRCWGPPRHTFGPCQATGCAQPSRINAGRGSGVQVCGKHYQRWRKYGDINAVVKGDTKRPVLNANGYVILRDAERPGRMQLEHRVVMARLLGRPLLRSENVHHLNGDRADNRPENLELWVKRQPPGQRVTDRITDAVDLLQRYAPHLLADDTRLPSAV